ncbi:TorF family putative porin [Methylomonas montana]|uniref:TorF family putative porin n=1 Tax=Methylomonas montana TaxID=3058963 RepID=UPI002659B56B|nr:TorF family putative porin [Methylomonas montana]WKJ89276.1 TorF family putative porin [Methylomonas montana]
MKNPGYWLSLFLLSVPVISCVEADWHGDVKLISEYIYRGYSKSRGNPVVQAHLEYQNSAGWFSGVELSQVRFDDILNRDRAEMELQPYLGWSQLLAGDWRGEVSARGYVFDNKLFNHRAEYAELYGSLHYQDWLTVQIAFAPDAYQREVDTLNYELNLRHDLLDNLQLSAGAGYYRAGALLGQNYFYWNAGVSWFATNYLAFDLRYVDSSLHEHYEAEPYLDEFYLRQQDNQYLFSMTLGF